MFSIKVKLLILPNFEKLNIYNKSAGNHVKLQINK